MGVHALAAALLCCGCMPEPVGNGRMGDEPVGVRLASCTAGW